MIKLIVLVDWFIYCSIRSCSIAIVGFIDVLIKIIVSPVIFLISILIVVKFCSDVK